MDLTYDRYLMLPSSKRTQLNPWASIDCRSQHPILSSGFLRTIYTWGVSHDDPFCFPVIQKNLQSVIVELVERKMKIGKVYLKSCETWFSLCDDLNTFVKTNLLVIYQKRDDIAFPQKVQWPICGLQCTQCMSVFTTNNVSLCRLHHGVGHDWSSFFLKKKNKNEKLKQS